MNIKAIGEDSGILQSILTPTIRAMGRSLEGPEPDSYSLRFELDKETGEIITGVFDKQGNLLRVIPMNRMGGLIINRTL